MIWTWSNCWTISSFRSRDHSGSNSSRRSFLLRSSQAVVVENRVFQKCCDAMMMSQGVRSWHRRWNMLELQWSFRGEKWHKNGIKKCRSLKFHYSKMLILVVLGLKVASHDLLWTCSLLSNYTALAQLLHLNERRLCSHACLCIHNIYKYNISIYIIYTVHTYTTYNISYININNM